MKRGSQYAKRVKQLFHQMSRKFGKPDLPEPADPIHQLVVGIFSENTSEHKARTLFKRICEQMVDLNELRVTPPMELGELIGSTVPLGHEKAERVIRVLNEIRQRQDALDLSFLKQRGRREAREYLESLDGVGSYAAASVLVHSLGGHAIPVDYLTVYVLRKEDLVDASASPSEVQGFLERHVSAADARAFSILLNRHVVAEGSRVPVDRLPELLELAPTEPKEPAEKAAKAGQAEAAKHQNPLATPESAAIEAQTEPKAQRHGSRGGEPPRKPAARGNTRTKARKASEPAPRAAMKKAGSSSGGSKRAATVRKKGK